MVRTNDQAQNMRHGQADEADQTGLTYGQTDHERRGDQEDQHYHLDIDAHGRGTFLPGE